LLGTEQKVWINDHEENRIHGAHLVGHTRSYVKVLLPNDRTLLGYSSY
jgi:hypothetical protein